MKRSPVELTLYTVALVGLAFSGAAETQVASVVASDHKLSPSEVKTLIKGASSPEDHLKLAEYFRQEALEETASARLHDEMAEAYEPGSAPPSKFKQPTSKEMKGHCREFARNAGRAAEIATKMAEKHQKLAEMMQTSPPQTTHRSR